MHKNEFSFFFYQIAMEMLFYERICEKSLQFAILPILQ